MKLSGRYLTLFVDLLPAGDAFALSEVMKHEPFLSEWKEQPIAYPFSQYFHKNRWRWDN